VDAGTTTDTPADSGAPAADTGSTTGGDATGSVSADPSTPVDAPSTGGDATGGDAPATGDNTGSDQTDPAGDQEQEQPGAFVAIDELSAEAGELIGNLVQGVEEFKHRAIHAVISFLEKLDPEQKQMIADHLSKK
jgi:hypothetical protein